MNNLLRLIYNTVIIFITLFIFTPSGFAQQEEMEDVVYLKNGNIIRGQILEQIVNESLKIETRGGSVFVFSMDEISRITKEKIKPTILEVKKEPVGRKRQPTLSFCLSLLLPGIGQFYNGEPTKGWIHMGLFAAGITAGALLDSGNDSDELDKSTYPAFVVVFAVYIWSSVDALTSARRINRENGWAFAPQISENLCLSITDLQIDKQATPGMKLTLKF